MHVAFERAAALRRAGALFFSALTEERALQTLSIARSQLQSRYYCCSAREMLLPTRPETAREGRDGG